jgi:CDP-diacylglycerol--glycerol-3-phosphate 3-phosphatidyltransferase
VDLGCSLALLAALVAIVIAYGARVAARGTARYDRVEREQGSALLGEGAMHMGYWAMQPLGMASVRLGIGPNAISWASLLFGAGAGAALAMGHFGLGAALSAVSGLCDALDGMVARLTRTASDAGEVLDAVIDRWVEFLFLAGLGVLYRGSVVRLVLVLFAILGSFMVSYATAKAEALRVPAPRGAMRKGERTVYLLTGAGLTPIAAAVFARLGVHLGLDDAPMVAALVLVAVVANISSLRRLARVASIIRSREARPPVAEPEAFGRLAG